MNPVGGNRSDAVGYGAASCTQTTSSVPSDVMPEPGQSTNAGDVLVAAQTILGQLETAAMTSAKAQIDAHTKQAQKAIADYCAAVKKAAEERREDGGFFSGIVKATEAFSTDLLKLDTITDPVGTMEESADKAGDATVNNRAFLQDLEKGALEVGKWAAVAGSVAVAVASCGAAAPIAALAIVGAVASVAGAADSSFHILEKCGVDAGTAGWIDLGMSLGGAVASGGAGIASAFAPLGASNVNQVVAVVGASADCVSAGSSIASGAARIAVAKFEEKAQLADADAQDAVFRRERSERRTDRVAESLKATVESVQRAMARCAEMMEQHKRTQVAIVRA